MDKEFIEKIQKRVMDLLKTLSSDLQIAAKDQCSEVVRLVGCWILNEHPEYGVQVCKGIFSDESAHDILVVEDGKVLFLIDPTIWQKFPESENILVGLADSMQEAISLLEGKYSGTWKVSEIIEKCGENYPQELLTVIKKNGQKV